ncbi:MAG: Coq4 family protein, partial [Bdellovibrionota bacterium]
GTRSSRSRNGEAAKPGKKRPIEIDEEWLAREVPDYLLKVRRHDPNNRNYWKELLITLDGARRVLNYTGDLQAVFEVLGNFPAADLLRFSVGRAAFSQHPKLGDLHKTHPIPYFGKKRVISWLDTMPEGSVGYEYAKYLAALKLEDIYHALDYMDENHPVQNLAKRYIMVHDFMHYFLGFEPFEPIGETLIESFFYAQDGAPNHILFVATYCLFLLDKNPGIIPQLLRENLEAYEYGKRAAQLYYVDWDQYLHRPLEEVRRELRVDERPVCRAFRFPKTPPRLAHVVLSVNNADKAEDFIQKLFGYKTFVKDPHLGLVALSAGDDHHTLAVQEYPTLSNLWRNAKRAWKLFRDSDGRIRSEKSGKKISRPPLSVVRTALNPGVQHIGFCVASDEDLLGYYKIMQSRGIKVEWACSHGGETKSLYVKLPGGTLAEFYTDSENAKKGLEEVRRTGKLPDEELVMDTYELNLPKDL